MKEKISIIGAGEVGATTALFLLQRGLAGTICLVDVAGETAQGKALDINEAASLLVAEPPVVVGTDDISQISDSAVVVVTAGFPRLPGMKRVDLLEKNARVITAVAQSISSYAPESVIIMVTNPLDVMTYLGWKKSGFEPARVMGQAGVLDSARFRYFIASECKVAVDEVSTIVAGGHGDSMVPLLSQTTLRGEQIAKVLPKEKIAELVGRTASGGGEVVSLLKRGAYYAPAAAVAEMVEAIIKDTGEILPVCAYLQGEYGLRDIYVGVPARLGSGGVDGVVELALSTDEKAALEHSAGLCRQALASIL